MTKDEKPAKRTARAFPADRGSAASLAGPVNLAGLQRSERLFRGLTENGLDSVAVLDREGRILYISPSVNRIWSRQSQSISLQDKLTFVHPSDHARVARGYARVLREPGVPMRAEYRVKHGDGAWRVVETVTTNLFSDPAIRGVVVSFRDITERKAAEERLKRSEAELRLLSQEIMEVAEKERARLARDLHDHIGSELAFFQTKVALLVNHQRKGQSVEAEMEDLLALSERIKEDCHRIVMTLGSTMIDHLGLMRSVEWYVEEFEKRSGIPCAADTQAGDVEMDKAVAMTAYRIVQEALTNIWKHAKASQARVEVMSSGKTLKVTVSDDGRGFDIHDQRPGHSLGILSMRERARLAGGSLTISSRVGQGTSVCARLPMEGGAARRHEDSGERQ